MSLGVLQNLFEQLNERQGDGSATAETAAVSGAVSAKPAPVLGCTPATAETAHSDVSGNHVAAQAANDLVPDPDRWCWPHSEAMNTAEIEMFTVRLMHFTSRGTAGAEALSDRLVQRDRDADSRCLCAECRHCRPGPDCRQGLAVVKVLQRCDQFTRHPALETDRPDGGGDQ